MKPSTKEKLNNLRHYVDGEINTWYERFMFVVVIVNIASLGIATSKSITPTFKTFLNCIDQVSTLLFIAELILKVIAYNRDFFGEKRIDDEGKEYFHINRWNISDLLIVVVSIFSSLSSFAVFRVFRIFRSVKDIKFISSLKAIKSLKLVNKFASLRSTFKGLLNAIPDILCTVCFLAIFAYTYAIIGTNVFSDEFPQFFGSLGKSLLTLCPIAPVSSWLQSTAREVMKVYSWAWIYFISYGFIGTTIIMQAITGIIATSIKEERERDEEKETAVNTVSVSELYDKISSLSHQIDELQVHLKQMESKP